MAKSKAGISKLVRKKTALLIIQKSHYRIKSKPAAKAAGGARVACVNNIS